MQVKAKTADVHLTSVAGLTEGERAEAKALSLAVYPPEQLASWPGRHLEWTFPSEWCVRVWSPAGELSSYTGIVTRQALHNGQPVKIGGLCGIKTHPNARKQGYAALGVEKALAFFREQQDIDFALLVCQSSTMDYYSKLGWQAFNGQLMVMQYGAQTEFTLNKTMTYGIKSAAPASGIIDLCGLPW